MFVTDGAVFMISLLGFSQICIDLIKNTIAKDCQTMLFSATYSDEVMDFVKRIIEKPGKLFLDFHLIKKRIQLLDAVRSYILAMNRIR
ncbi:unnamed protein product [Rotaria sp. Silwood1]|nr:unnamed protein product [Rotaria sp. Silwood1]